MKLMKKDKIQLQAFLKELSYSIFLSNHPGIIATHPIFIDTLNNYIMTQELATAGTLHQLIEHEVRCLSIWFIVSPSLKLEPRKKKKKWKLKLLLTSTDQIKFFFYREKNILNWLLLPTAPHFVQYRHIESSQYCIFTTTYFLKREKSRLWLLWKCAASMTV